MARRLYSAGLFDEGRKSSRTESYSSPMSLLKLNRDSSGLEQIPKPYRYSSAASVTRNYSSTPRSTKTSLGVLSVHIQSMKRSAFKMLCKFIWMQCQ